jgi:hypothetical protein
MMNKIHSHNRPAMLYPKEHGAYAMLGIPLMTALAASGFTVAGVWVAIAAIAGFFSNEPLLVACGHRGGRVQHSTPQAKGWFVGLFALAGSACLIALIVGNVSMRVALGVFLIFAVISLAFSIAGQNRKTAVHLWGMLSLSLPCVPVLLSANASVSTSLSFWAVWLIGFAATTLAVRGMMARQKQGSRWWHLLALAGLTSLIGAGVFSTASWLLVTLPMIAVSWYLLILPPPIQQLKRVGWTMVAGTLSTAILTLAIFAKSG